MYLLKFRLIGHPLIPDSSWIEVGRGLTVIRAGSVEQSSALLHMLQTISPPYAIAQVQPFKTFSPYAPNQEYPRRVIAAKKTAVIAIFGAPPQLVRELAALDQALYDIDRIELGRRRDYSRWMNFVELASSTRWSEIAPAFDLLLSHLYPDEATGLRTILAGMQDTDRLKGEKAERIRAGLHTLCRHLPEEQQTECAPCFQAIDRARHFAQAKEIVFARLPLIFSFSEFAPAQPDQGTGIGMLPISWLVARLREQHEQDAGVEQFIRQLNLRLRQPHLQSRLKFRIAGEMLVLASDDGAVSSLLGGGTPAAKTEMLMAGLALLHTALGLSSPMFLLDPHALEMETHERLELLAMLRRYCLQGQCLVAADDNLFSLCAASNADSGNARLPEITCVDCEQ